MKQLEEQSEFVPSYLWGNPDWKIVHQGKEALSNEDSSSELEAVTAAYVSRQFMSSTNQKKDVITVPNTYSVIESSTEGEKAEALVFNRLKEASSRIDGLKLILFSGLRTAGVMKDEDQGKVSIKEIDFREGLLVQS